MKNYSEFLFESKLQDDYRELFSKLLSLYGVKSPKSFKGDEEKSKKFFGEISKSWSKGVGLTEYGEKIMKLDKLEDLDKKEE